MKFFSKKSATAAPTTKNRIMIDKNVPIPAKKKRGRPCLYPWYEMKPNDSFFCTGYILKSTGAHVMPTTMGKKVHTGSKWTTRQVVENGDAGVRVWRLK